METTITNTNEVKKELYRSKVMAKFSHYTAGNLYYTVQLESGIYQFPISTVEQILSDAEQDKFPQAVTLFKLSSDLGTTNFSAEVRGSELNRWIAKAIEKNDFTKIS